jgi:hypothetical protein
MVGDQMRMNAGLAHELRKRVVERFQRPPAPMHEVEPAGVQVAPGRHARKAADIVVVECHRRLREPIEVRGGDRGSAITAEAVADQRIEEDEDRAHAGL